MKGKPFTFIIYIHLLTTSDVELEEVEEYLGGVEHRSLELVVLRDPCDNHTSCYPYTSCTRESSLRASHSYDIRPCDTYPRGALGTHHDTLRGSQGLKAYLHLLLRKLRHYQRQTLRLKVYEPNHLLKLKLLPSPIA